MVAPSELPKPPPAIRLSKASTAAVPSAGDVLAVLAAAGSTAAAAFGKPVSPRVAIRASNAATQSVNNAIAVLAAKAQAAHLVALLANNQQLLGGIRAQDVSVRSSVTSMSGVQRPTAGSDNTSLASGMPPPLTRHPSLGSSGGGGGGSQRDNASRRLSAILTEMRSEAEGPIGGDGMLRQRRRSDVEWVGADVSGAGMMGPPPTPDELAAAASSLDIDISSGSAPTCSSQAPRWKNLLKVE